LKNVLICFWSLCCLLIIGCGNDRTYTGQTSYYRGMGIINDTTALVIKDVIDEYNDGDYSDFVGYNFEMRDTRSSRVYSEHLYENFSSYGLGQVSDSVFLFGRSSNEDFLFWKIGDSLNSSMYKKYTWLTEKKDIVSLDMVVRRWNDNKFVIQNWFMGKEINMVYYIVMDTTALTLASVDSSEYALLNAYDDFQMFDNELVFLQNLKDTCGFMLLKEGGDTLATHDCDDSYRDLTLYFQNDYIAVMDGYVSSDHIRHVFSIGPDWKISDEALMYYDGSGHFYDSEGNRI
jgi:hypothetical protein